MKFTQDVDRDAQLVVAAMHGLLPTLGIKYNLTPQQLHEHGEWLRKQSDDYINKVTARAVANKMREVR